MIASRKCPKFANGQPLPAHEWEVGGLGLVTPGGKKVSVHGNVIFIALFVTG